MAKVFIICGHGAGDPGAVAGGQTEADLVRRLASRMQAIGGGDVQVGDTSRNWYADNGIGRGQCPAGVPVVELHMDSAGAGARGGHVIVKSGFKPDGIDNALASFVGGFFPGRAKTVVGRSDLANVNRAAVKGVNYRLLECCFISDDGDRAKFMNQMDDVARGILAAFGVNAGDAPAPAPQPPAPQPSGITVDGLWGAATTRRAQQLAGLVADGEVWGQWTGNRAKLPGCTTGWKWVTNPQGSPLIRWMQANVLGIKADGIAGPEFANAMIRRYGNGIQDGRLDAPSTAIKGFQNSLNAGRF